MDYLEKYYLVGQEENKGILNYYDLLKIYKKDWRNKKIERTK